jgi:UPF0176 protein
VNDGCHLLFIQCDNCKETFESCCSVECKNVLHLPIEEQKAIRKGSMISNKIFKKGRSEKLEFKKNAIKPYATLNVKHK